MKIVNLIENTEGSRDCKFEHGLSFYVETRNHKLLVDTGATDLFISNAEKLGVDLKQVDLLVLSHGHYDHAGGICAFASLNPDARIIMQSLAGEAYYHKNNVIEKYIGIDGRISSLPQIELVEGNKRIDDELFLFSGVTGRKLWPAGNRELKVKRNGKFFQDEFSHEQYLVVEENHQKVLLSGCAHNGILNILEKYREIYGAEPNTVISGFHMRKKSDYTEDDLKVIKETAGELKKTRAKYYTGHCTGELPYQIMKERMGDQLIYVHSGDEITI